MPFDPSLVRICPKEMVGKGMCVCAKGFGERLSAKCRSTCNAETAEFDPGVGKS